MTPQLTIRAIEPADAPEWRRLWHDYLVFYETTLPEDVYAATFARLTSGAPGEYRGFLALLGDRPVGLNNPEVRVNERTIILFYSSI